MDFYKKFAKYYDSFYSSQKNYKAETERIRTIIKKRKLARGRDMLDAACGTGNHIKYFKKYFNVTGLDINPEMLKIARQKYPDVKFIRDDMRTFRINKQFDIIVCLFSSIGHLKTYANLEKAVRNFSKHLKPGGVVIMEPFIDPEKCIDNILDAFIIDETELKLVRMNTGKIKGNTVVYDFHVLAGTRGKIRYFSEKVELGLFERKKVLDIMKKTGLSAEFLEKQTGYHRGIYVGVKQS
jgi:ubiquinone/menaquinone biosynthesis C-methylase UbiE